MKVVDALDQLSLVLDLCEVLLLVGEEAVVGREVGDVDPTTQP